MTLIQGLNKVLFINFGGIGDEILFFPVLADFKKNYPQAKITLMLEPRSASSASLTNFIDETIGYDVKKRNKITSFLDLLGIISNKRYDAVISSGSNKFISVLLFLSRVKIRVGYDSGTLSKKLLSTAVALNKQQYAGSMYHDLLKGVGIDNEAPLPEVFVSEDSLSNAAALLGETAKPIIIIHPGVSKLSVQKKIIKSWPEQKWAELILALIETDKYKVALSGGPDDEQTIKHIREFLAQIDFNKDNFVDLYGKTRNLADLAGLIKRADLLLCVDSAPMHIAVGVNTKVVAIFGPTDENKLLPKNKDFLALRKQELTCRPCLWDKRQQVCDTPSCLDLSVEDMLAAIDTQQI